MDHANQESGIGDIFDLKWESMKNFFKTPFFFLTYFLTVSIFRLRTYMIF